MKSSDKKTPAGTTTGQFHQQEHKLDRLRRRYEQLEQQLTELERRLPQLPSDEKPSLPNKPR